MISHQSASRMKNKIDIVKLPSDALPQGGDRVHEQLSGQVLEQHLDQMISTAAVYHAALENEALLEHGIEVVDAHVHGGGAAIFAFEQRVHRASRDQIDVRGCEATEQVSARIAH